MTDTDCWPPIPKFVLSVDEVHVWRVPLECSPAHLRRFSALLPRLSSGSLEPSPQFNLSHSGELILIALTIGRAVGIDVERIRNDIEVERLAVSFFSPH